MIPELIRGRGLTVALIIAPVSWILSLLLPVLTGFHPTTPSLLVATSVACLLACLICCVAWICLIQDAGLGYPYLKCSLAAMLLLGATFAPIVGAVYVLNSL